MQGCMHAAVLAGNLYADIPIMLRQVEAAVGCSCSINMHCARYSHPDAPQLINTKCCLSSRLPVSQPAFQLRPTQNVI